jgi:hypothetical protein
MIPRTGRKIIAHILVLLAAGVLMAGCGKKAPPRPSGRETAPAAVGNLSKTLSGDTLSLTWGPVAGKAAVPAGFYVYRSKIRLPDSVCPSCPVLFERVAVIPYPNQGAGDTTLRSFEYRETLESGYRYIYKVSAYSQSGSTGKDSNTVEFNR